MPSYLKLKGLSDSPLRLKLTSVGKELSAADIAGAKNVHAGCGGSISIKHVCSKCGEEEPRTEKAVDGMAWCQPEALTEAGTFEVKGRVENTGLAFAWTSATYLAEIADDVDSTAALAAALTKQGLIGYVRMRPSSQERPALLYTPERGMLAFSLLFYNDAEVTPSLPVYEDAELNLTHVIVGKVMSLPSQSIGGLERRMVCSKKR